MIDEWDEAGDNIFIWDFYSYETEGGLYLLDKYAVGPSQFSSKQRIFRESSSVILQVYY